MENILKRYRPWILAGVSALLLFLSFPNVSLFPCGWIALVPVFVALLEAPRWKTAFWVGYVTGFLFFAGLLLAILLLYPYATIFATAAGYLALVGYTAVYFGIFGVLLRLVPRRSGVLFTLAAAATWTGLEWVRSWMVTGFPWGSIGYSQWNNRVGIQIADVVGVHGISFVMVLFNISVAVLIANRRRWREAVRVMVLPLLLTFFCFGYGFLQVRAAVPTGSAMKIAMVPGNISQLQKWDIRQFPNILQRYINMTYAADQESPDLIIWPETAIRSEVLTGQWPTYHARFAQMLREVDTPILIGAATTGDAVDSAIGGFTGEPLSSDAPIYNRILSIGPAGEIHGAYAKMHLVPFGEYVPLADLIPDFVPNFIQFKPFTPGKGVNLLPVFSVKNSAVPEQTDIGISICFESVFPDEFRRPVKKGAAVMGIFTNDAWFKDTAFPELHLSMAPFRAIENRIPLFRCANGGYTCVVDASGKITTPRITAETDQEILVASVPMRAADERLTFYTRYGDWFPILCTLGCLVGFGIIGVRRWQAKRLFEDSHAD